MLTCLSALLLRPAENLCFHLLALSDIKIRGEREAQLQGIIQRSPSVLTVGGEGLNAL